MHEADFGVGLQGALLLQLTRTQFGRGSLPLPLPLSLPVRVPLNHAAIHAWR